MFPENAVTQMYKLYAKENDLIIIKIWFVWFKNGYIMVVKHLMFKHDVCEIKIWQYDANIRRSAFFAFFYQ